MPAIRFLQIHTLHEYTASLLNRDDSGLAKRLPYGDAIRTRISSQCLKRHWRIADDPHALKNLMEEAESFRSRELVTKKVIVPLEEKFPDDVLKALGTWFQYAIYSGNPKEKPKKFGTAAKTDDKGSRPTLLFGAPELQWLAQEFERLAREANGDAKQAFALGEKWCDCFKDNIKVMRKNAELPAAGLTAALFGRMVTSDPAANIDAPVHVAHAFTVHAEEAESDYFTAVDDLRGPDEDSGADTIQETELTSGLYYGYAVIDLPGLVKNCGGDRELAAKVTHNLIYLIAEVSPGAKLGSTAPYGRAEFLLAETGDRQPRSLAAAYRKAVTNDPAAAVAALASHLKGMDDAYATGETRRFLSLVPAEIPAATSASLAKIAEWAAAQVKEAVE